MVHLEGRVVAGEELPATAALAGLWPVLVVALLHRRRPADDPVLVLGGAARPLARAFWVDELYDRTLVRPTRAFARSVLSIDRSGVDATVVGAGTAVGLLGGALRRAQNGNVQAYASGLVVGVLVVVVAVSLAVAR